MTTLQKVAMIRDPSVPMGQRGPVWLNCPCGAKPATDIDSKADVTCQCGRVFSYNGWLRKEEARS